MIRPAIFPDAAAIAEIHVRAWQQAYHGIVPTEYLNSLSVPAYVERWQRNLANPQGSMLVYFQGDSMAGWTSFGTARDEDMPSASEIYGLYVDPASWGSGIGRELLQAAENSLPKSEDISLWVFSQNARAIQFYERTGYCFDSSEKILQFGGVGISALRMNKPTAQ